MEEVAICIAFDGVAGTWGCCGLLPAGDVETREDGERAGEARTSEEILLMASGFAIGRGGGLGDTETAVTDAEWAW